MGMGIWTMHFVGMLAFIMPMVMFYEVLLTIISMLIAILASGFSFFMITGPKMKPAKLAFGGVALGLGIASMHYTGMAAMYDVEISYIPSLFVLSIAVAIGASVAALILMIKSSHVKSYGLIFKFISALVMGFAICGMHYIGMAAAIFYPAADTRRSAYAIDPTNLSYSIVITTIVIMIIALIASKLWSIALEIKNEKLIDAEKKLMVAARSAGMAEVATSMLHNVGNVLNSINISTQVLLARTAANQIDALLKLGNLLEANKNHLDQFLKEDPKGKILGNYLLDLSKYFAEEEKFVHNELTELHTKVQHVKNIIATQQTLSKSESNNENIEVNSLIDYALVINSVEKNTIEIVRNYESNLVVFADKVKLLQILINLTKNAQEALLSSHRRDKKIIINTRTFNKEYVLIEIIDNGVGIKPEDLPLIYNYGFTTKETGNGFGLHTTALSVQAMGGELNAFSEGVDKGAKFTLILKMNRLEQSKKKGIFSFLNIKGS